MASEATFKKLLEEMVRRFTQNEVAPFDMEIDREGRLPKGLFQKLQDLGFLNAILPLDSDGAALNMTEAANLIKQLAYGNASVGVLLEGQYKTLYQLMKYGNDDIKERYLPKANHEIFAFGNTEPSGGSNPSGHQATARQNGSNKWVINGDKIMITNGTLAKNYIVVVKTDSDEFSCFLVDTQMPGVSFGQTENFIGLRGIPFGELVLDNVTVDESHLLGKRGQGLEIANHAHDDARILMGAVLTGIMEHIISVVKEYVQQRQAGQVLLKDLLLTHEKIAEIVTNKELTRLAYTDAARSKDERKTYTQLSAITKSFGSRAAVKAGDMALQLLGGYGYSYDYPIEHLIRDARAMEIAEGTVEKMFTEITQAEFIKEV